MRVKINILVFIFLLTSIKAAEYIDCGNNNKKYFNLINNKAIKKFFIIKNYRIFSWKIRKN